MSLENKKRRAICYNSGTDSEIENDINNNMHGRKNIKIFKIFSSSESEDFDVHGEETFGKIIWNRKCINLIPASLA